MATAQKTRSAAVRAKAGRAQEAKQAELEPTGDMIATRAYEIWQENGCPEGRDLEDWFQAERELRTVHEE